MNYLIENLPERKIVFMRNVGPYGNNGNFEMMKEFKRWIKENGYSENVERFGVYGIAQDNPEAVAPEKCRYDVMLAIQDEIKDDKVLSGVFKGGKYAVFSIEHTKEGVTEFLNSLGITLQNEKLEMKNEPMIERYKEEEGKDKICEMLIPIL